MDDRHNYVTLLDRDFDITLTPANDNEVIEQFAPPEKDLDYAS